MADQTHVIKAKGGVQCSFVSSALAAAALGSLQQCTGSEFLLDQCGSLVISCGVRLLIILAGFLCNCYAMILF